MTTYLELDRSLAPEHQALKENIHQFAEHVLRPAAAALDRLCDPHDVIAPGSPLWDVFGAAYANGFHTALIPNELGGMGLRGLGFHIVLEELGWGSADFALGLAVSGFPFSSIALLGSPELVEEIVVPFVAEREPKSIGCWGITEPSHGSDQFMPGTAEFKNPAMTGSLVATRDGDDYVINGEKAQWVTNGTIANRMLAHVTLDPSLGMAGGGVAYIPLDLPGVSKTGPLDKLGQRALNQGGNIFDNVRIPSRYMLVDTYGYEAVLTRTLVLTNGTMGAVFTGLARAAYEEALAYTQSRVQGGKPICEHQLVQKRLFDMFTKVETCRALSRAAIVYNDSVSEPSLEYAIAAKVYCTQAALEVADSAIQLFGGKGLAKGCLVEKLYRDARASLIEDGSNDILALTGMQRILAAQLVH